jgi:hypothetical protein
MKPNAFNQREKEIQKRGILTQRVKDLSNTLFGRPISVTELRLMAYVQDRAMNGHKIEMKCVNRKELEFLEIWFKKGWMTGGYENFCLSREFWDKMSQLMYMAYVDLS